MAAVTDFRIEVGFFSHIKTRRLERKLTGDGVTALLRLWEYAAQNAPDGNLRSHDPDEIEIAAGWNGEPGALATALVEIGFIDETDAGYVLHDWAEHQPWVVNAPARAEKARKAANARHGRPESAPGAHQDAPSNAQPKAEDATSMPVACPKHASSNAPSPSPSPSPKPPERARASESNSDPNPPPENAESPPQTAEEQMARYNWSESAKTLHQAGAPYPHTVAMLKSWNRHAPPDLQLTGKPAENLCRSICLPEHYPLDEWEQRCREAWLNPTLAGKDKHWRATFSWAIKPCNWVKMRGGEYPPAREPPGPAAHRVFNAEAHEAAEDPPEGFSFVKLAGSEASQ